MTNQELIDYYANLLILQYIGKPRAYATVEASVTPFIMDQLPIAVQNAFGIDTAVGVQLDILGKYIGVSRNGYTFTGPITLTDAEFRVIMKVAIIKNSSGSSLAAIQALLHQFFPGTLLVFDYANMQMDYFFDSSIGSKPLAELFVQEDVLPKPMGVQLGSLIYSANVAAFFGFRTYALAGYNVTGFNNYASYDMNSPWLSYADAIT